MTLAENNDIVLKFYKQNYIDELSEEVISTFNIPLGEYYKKSYIDDSFYTKAELDTKLDNKANSTHTHNISDVTGLSTSLDGKMSNDYSESTIESNFFAHKIGNIVIVTWWNPTLPTTQNSWVDWKTLPYKSCNTQHIWVDVGGIGREERVIVLSNSNILQVFIS